MTPSWAQWHARPLTTREQSDARTRLTTREHSDARTRLTTRERRGARTRSRRVNAVRQEVVRFASRRYALRIRGGETMSCTTVSAVTQDNVVATTREAPSVPSLAA